MLKILNLETAYGQLRVLKGISLHVSTGEAVAIIGANGAGKTALLKTIAGILRPRSGTVMFDKREINGEPPEKIVGMGCCLVPEGRHVFSTMTVKENLILGAYLRQRKGASADSTPSTSSGQASSPQVARHYVSAEIRLLARQAALFRAGG